MKYLRISDTLALPIDATARAIALVGLRGSGKTHTTAVLVEQAHHAGVPVVILDPVGAWWGLQSSADGKGPGLPFVVFGGDHADVPLEEGAGEVLANLILDDQMSAVLDLSLLRKNARKRFAEVFAEQLYHRCRSAMLLVIEEAPMFAPQRTDHGGERLLGAMEDIVLRGRGRGLGVVCITQRAALLNKNLLSQCEVLVALRQSHNLDIKAIKEWVDEQGQEAESQRVIRMLPKMPTGECFVWAPVLDILSHVKIRKRETFDSSATPKPGERKVVPKKRAELDLDAIRTRIASTIERAKADDPKALKAKIAELDKQIRVLSSQRVEVPVPQRVDVPVLGDQARAALERLTAEFVTKADEVLVATRSVQTALRTVGTPRYDPTKPIVNGLRDAAFEVRQPPRALAPRRSAPPVNTSNGDAREIGGGERRVLIAIAQHAEGVTRAQLTVLVGLKQSSRDSYIKRLLTAGCVERMSDGSIRATADGMATVGDDFTPLPTGEALRDHWYKTLPASEAMFLREICAVYPQELSRETLTEQTSLKQSSRDSYLKRLLARRLIEAPRPGLVRASETLFS